ncbi:unnamed protein product [Caenorhabditis auriculariae]|uniref:Queuosine 5'-phosphate N-glycosylase/hydrolase n=1 Tax=Caenorhabditis auriculariae TaxID=2777116 RepID=A0A8S1HD23_9PELO|nr:unnamed protein product [Caenorhabditis auriculariae]
MDGTLSPSDSGKFIAEHGEFIKINQEGVEKAAKLILDAVKNDSIKQVLFAAHVLHPKTADEKAVQWVFFMDTINFSFWPDEGKKYDVSYKGVTYTGYFAGCAALNKALDSGKAVTSAQFMATASEEVIDEIFKSDSGESIPLLKQRVQAINEAGRVLSEKFGGLFYNCVVQANRSAQKLLSIIVENFESFRDFAVYRGQKVSLLKRAQILVADVHGALEGYSPEENFNDIGSLTMFADYRVPQAMAFLGVLEYSEGLLQRLGEGKRLENGSQEEVELRGFSIHGCQKIVEAIRDLREKDPNYADLPEVPDVEVDVFIWVYRRQHAQEIEAKVPFHRTRCIYY